MNDETRALSDRSDQTPLDEELSSLSAPLSQPHRVRVRVESDGMAIVGRKRVPFGRSLAGALVTVEGE